ncbi:synaptotagmin-15-like [Penaeus chinensis]|uniref:synaptotagmin-15-like n=1 Tax=Penaeus chinensis TaxID=139456 RepID=UPI001FB7EA71|nr:synaptotagmin-15-like [Penaeus chinensis]
MSKVQRQLSPNGDPAPGFTKTFQNRLILPLGNFQDRLVLPQRSREVTFTVPPTVSPLSPRRALGDCSPLSPRRLGSGDTTPVGSQAGSEYGGDSRTTTPSPGLLRGSFTDIPAVSGAACSLGTINPELYKTDELEGEYDQYPDDHIGRVWLQLEYFSDSEKLLVNLIKAKNLPSRLIGSINACDPYVRLYLMPDERRYLQTKTRRKTCNPRFDETFCFQSADPHTVTLVIILDDGYILYRWEAGGTERSNHLQETCRPKTIRNTPTKAGREGKRMIRRDLEREVSLSPRQLGQLELTLCYNDNLERLTVTVGAARQLKVEDDRSDKNEFQARIALMQQTKVTKTKKTGVVKGTDSPSFYESFNFKVAPDALDTTAVCVTVTVRKKICGARMQPVKLPIDIELTI